MSGSRGEVAVPALDRRSARRQETRDEIIAAAWELVREKGLAGDLFTQMGQGPAVSQDFPMEPVGRGYVSSPRSTGNAPGSPSPHRPSGRSQPG